VDSNKRLALAAVLAFFGLNGVRMTLTNDQAYELVVAIASGDLGDVAVITKRLEGKDRAPRCGGGTAGEQSVSGWTHRGLDGSPRVAVRIRVPGRCRQDLWPGRLTSLLDQQVS
jgi:Prophage maintenance system killer protein